MTKKCILAKTGDENEVSDLAISAQKYSKIVSQEKKKNQGSTRSKLWGQSVLCHFIFKETHIDVIELILQYQATLGIQNILVYWQCNIVFIGKFNLLISQIL